MAAKKKTPAESAGDIAVAAIIAEMAEMNVIPDSKETALLAIARDALDHIAVLQDVIETEGRMQITPTGVSRVHPALVEHRQQTLSLSKVLAAIVIGDSMSGIPKNVAAQKAVNARWARRDTARAKLAQDGA